MAQEQKITYKEFMLKKRQEENAKRLSNLEQNVPKEMKELKQWCAFKTYYDMEKKETKKFVLKTDGHWAKPNDLHYSQINRQ